MEKKILNTYSSLESRTALQPLKTTDLRAPCSCISLQVNFPQSKSTQIIVYCFDESWDLRPSSAFLEVVNLLESPAPTTCDSNKNMFLICRGFYNNAVNNPTVKIPSNQLRTDTQLCHWLEKPIIFGPQDQSNIYHCKNSLQCVSLLQPRPISWCEPGIKQI